MVRRRKPPCRTSRSVNRSMATLRIGWKRSATSNTVAPRRGRFAPSIELDRERQSLRGVPISALMNLPHEPLHKSGLICAVVRISLDNVTPRLVNLVAHEGVWHHMQNTKD